ncbi:uncharacterized protein TrAFT101_002684 [Trichoderma asperellum]|uniref:uncharacterized protein n=1 Tax=Trichoderma asperellum TaxID=101201 RepID=UPI0033179C85|nr:hypothetical protein TrAFT101_002684 [Trichoderma asperellum]
MPQWAGLDAFQGARSQACRGRPSTRTTQTVNSAQARASRRGAYSCVMAGSAVASAGALHARSTTQRLQLVLSPDTTQYFESPPNRECFGPAPSPRYSRHLSAGALVYPDGLPSPCLAGFFVVCAPSHLVSPPALACSAEKHPATRTSAASRIC